ncbi:hypothetical protein AVEN_92893-1 [Araneus ventricosus]|uniref:Uncharacterized protein n=1 Tax=Araneus ventricosus TaxID=182803 RepID=A0A4Y2D116_ARAVE|nr:hypothetical protein AVEN_92893-1 [Araneus ventricosus]
MSPVILILWQERDIDRGFSLEANPMNPDLVDKPEDHFGDFGDKTKIIEIARIIALSLKGREMWRTFERISYDKFHSMFQSANYKYPSCSNEGRISLWNFVSSTSWCVERY